MSGKFIVSSNGFYCGTKFIYDEVYTKKIIGQEHEWSKHLRLAKPFKLKFAKLIISKFNLDAFIWSPFEEEAIKGRYNVVERKSHNSWDDDTEHKVLEWYVVRVFMESKSDAKFLKNGGELTNYNSFEEATEIARKKNLEMLIELETKMNIPNVIKNETFSEDERIII